MAFVSGAVLLQYMLRGIIDGKKCKTDPFMQKVFLFNGTYELAFTAQTFMFQLDSANKVFKRLGTRLSKR